MPRSIHRQHWQLNEETVFLNHGSFGATPTVVLETQQRFRDALESDPIAFLAPERTLEPKLDRVREIIAKLVHADAQDIAFVRNVTDAVNAVVRSMPLETGNEIVVTDHGYNACNNAVRFAAERSGAVVRTANIPFPIEHPDQVLAAIESELNGKTRFLLVDHVTSPTGLVWPVERITQMARARGVRVMVDGAHAPGMLNIDLGAIDADYYAANHHKFLCGPKVSGFLWVRRELQQEVRPSVISHAANRARPNRSRFLAEFDWTGTYDATPLLAIESAIEFLDTLLPSGLEALMAANHTLALQARELLLNTLEIETPAPSDMIGCIATVPLPNPTMPFEGLDPLQVKLREQHRIEVPVFRGPQSAPRLLRISSHAYNDIEQYERLADALVAELHK